MCVQRGLKYLRGILDLLQSFYVENLGEFSTSFIFISQKKRINKTTSYEQRIADCIERFYYTFCMSLENINFVLAKSYSKTFEFLKLSSCKRILERGD